VRPHYCCVCRSSSEKKEREKREEVEKLGRETGSEMITGRWERSRHEQDMGEPVALISYEPLNT
jgi:hypothetical protein